MKPIINLNRPVETLEDAKSYITVHERQRIALAFNMKPTSVWNVMHGMTNNIVIKDIILEIAEIKRQGILEAKNKLINTTEKEKAQLNEPRKRKKGSL